MHFKNDELYRIMDNIFSVYRKLPGFVLMLFLLTGSSCNAQSKDSWAAGEVVVDTLLDTYFGELAHQEMFNGAVAIKKNGVLLLKKGYGKANFRFGTDFTPSTPMEVASVSKQFTSAAIMILNQEGRLDIDARAQEYLGPDFPYPEITVRHLLSHTSGLVNYEPYFRKNWDTAQIVYNKDILNYFKNEKPDLMSIPGEKYHYSNPGYVMLAEIVNVVSGLPLDKFLETHIFLPAGMDNSTFYGRDTIWRMKNYAPGYMLDLKSCGYVHPEDLPGKYYYYFLSGRFGSGRLSSTVDDLIKWDSVLYRNDILNKESKQQLFQINMPVKDTSDYGFGWHIYTDSVLGKVVYHTGSWAGNLSYIKRFIDDNSLIITLNNTHDVAYMKNIRDQVEGYLKGEPLKIPALKLEYLIQKKICDLNLQNLDSWYAGLPKEMSVNLKTMRKLEKDYRDADETEKADIVEQLISLTEEK